MIATVRQELEEVKQLQAQQEAESVQKQNEVVKYKEVSSVAKEKYDEVTANEESAMSSLPVKIIKFQVVL